MHLDQRYLKRVAVPVTEEPTEVVLNGEEQRGGPAVSVDDTDNTWLSVVHRDGYTEDERFDLPQGTDKRTTFVIPRRADEPVGAVGYRFRGLIQLDDIRLWYRAKLGIVEPEPEVLAAPTGLTAQNNRDVDREGTIDLDLTTPAA